MAVLSKVGNLTQITPSNPKKPQDSVLFLFNSPHPRLLAIILDLTGNFQI